MSGRVKVIEESASGRNREFKDTRTGHVMTRAEFVQRIEAGVYPNYHVRVVNGLKTPASDPDRTEENNLG